MYRNNCVEEFIEHTEDEVKQLYATFPQQPMAEFTDVLKRKHEAAKKCHICLKEFNNPEDRKVRDHCHYTGLCRGETKLPPKNALCSWLKMKGISDQDYEHEQQVWDTMENKTLGCYRNTYLKTDVLLLADVFETFRNTCLENCKLYPAHFYTAPGLGWQALLNTASEYCEHEVSIKTAHYAHPDEFRLELLRDIEKLLMFEKGIRRGITQAVKRYAKGNNKYMKDQYNPDEKSTYLQYLDTNNFYRWAVIQKLPTHGFS